MGNGGSKCTKQDHIDPKPSVDMNVGITVAGSQGCKSCVLSFSQQNTASAVTLTRKVNTLIIRPFSPFTITFNGTQAVFTEIRLIHPAPLRVEGVQADAALQCVDDNNTVTMIIPLASASGDTGTGFGFLNTIAANLDGSTSGGLGIVNKDTGEYEQTTVNTGQHWSITNLVSSTDPYFTWVNSELVQYVKSDSQCDRYLGWKSTPGAQVIYFQNPVKVSSADINKLNATVGAVLPKDVLSTVTNPLYVAGSPQNCPPKLPKLNPPSLNMDAKFLEFLSFFVAVCCILLGVVAAIAFVNSGIMNPVANGIARLFRWPTEKGSTP